MTPVAGLSPAIDSRLSTLDSRHSNLWRTRARIFTARAVDAAARFTKAAELKAAAEGAFLQHRTALAALGFTLELATEDDDSLLQLRDVVLVFESRCFRPDCAVETIIFLPGTAGDRLPLKIAVSKPLLEVVAADLVCAVAKLVGEGRDAELDDGCGCDSGPTHGLM